MAELQPNIGAGLRPSPWESDDPHASPISISEQCPRVNTFDGTRRYAIATCPQKTPITGHFPQIGQRKSLGSKLPLTPIVLHVSILQQAKVAHCNMPNRTLSFKT